MKKILFALLAIGVTTSFSLAEMKCAPGKCGGGKCGSSMKSSQTPKKMFQSVSQKEAILLQKGKDKASCIKCGMHLPKFFKTNHAATVGKDTRQYCSIHCVVEDMRNGASPKDIKVVDTNSLKFIDASKASYVVGSNKKGTMSLVSKYAFGQRKDANLFAKYHGGKVVDFKGALEAAKTDFLKDINLTFAP